ncbi:hypothetical protein C0995_009013 [Termitomyces sp. Mi166|nr:hypothetical protein C0995_009013 [Termitomyces sp. Mi166\
MQTATQACNLHALLAEDTDVQSTAVEMIKEINTTNTEDAHGFCLASLLDPTAPDFMLDSNATSIELAEGKIHVLPVDRLMLSFNSIESEAEAMVA